METKYRMEDGTIVNLEKSKNNWEEETDWNGSNHISRATGSQWYHQKLFESRKGRFYVEHWSNMQGDMAHAEWIDEREAVRWLLLNEHEVPERLEHLIDDVEE